MRYYWKVYLWENGQKTTDLTKWCIAPIFFEDKLDETLDTGEIILDGMPIEMKKAFLPKTKFRIERYITKENTDLPKTYDLVVEHDDVETFAGAPKICTHRIHLIEASVIAQGMHVDNIALTYELQDVNLNYKTVQSSSETLGDKNAVIKNDEGYDTPVHINQKMAVGDVYFRNSYRYVWSEWENLKSLLWNQDVRTPHTVSFKIPTLTCQGSFDNVGWSDIVEVDTTTEVIKRHWRGETLLTEIAIPLAQGKTKLTCGPAGLPEICINEVYGIKNSDKLKPDGTGGTTPIKEAHIVKIRDFNSKDTGMITSVTNLDTFNDSLSLDSPALSYDSDYDNKEVSFTTDILSSNEIERGERFTYEIKCISRGSDSKEIIFFTIKCTVRKLADGWSNDARDGVFTYISGDERPKVSATMNISDLNSDGIGSIFLASAKKYNCYELLQKALLTCDTQILDNSKIGLADLQYGIFVDDEKLKNRLIEQTMNETMFESKNLWEVLIQIGYYLHAIPCLTFAEDGTDRLVLSFTQLGGSKTNDNSSRKLTVFNSLNLSNYFTQYDSYVSNLFSPQNEVEEWMVCKTSDNSYLVSNNTAELHTKNPILEIVEFDIIYNEKKEPALKFIYEKNIYSILNVNAKVRPSKAAALCYTLGDNKITGLNYTPPSANNDEPFALKTIVSSLYGVKNVNDIKFNDIQFHIKYRTQDSLRISQMRPDIQNFMKNSTYEKYPHHEQFYGQQDKMVDSERFTANLWGKLIRVGNGIYQCQEYATADSEKESGDLVFINGENYYVTEIENEFYADAIFQKVTYSKNFNQLSQIVTIPSEPRFYEVSEQSQVRRDVRLNDFCTLSTTRNSLKETPTFLNKNTWRKFIKDIIFRENEPLLPNFAYTCFKADVKRKHTGSYGQTLSIAELFPSVEIEENNGNIIPKPSRDHRDVIVPLLHFPLRNAIVFEWDMDDNFKAGDSINTAQKGKEDIIDEAYYTLQPVRYCDVMGRADLFNFKLFNKTKWLTSQMQRLPFAESGEFVPSDEQSDILLPSNLSIGLDKDNREALSFNYQINLVYNDASFVTFSNLFGEKTGRLKMCLLKNEVSLFDERISFEDKLVVKDNITYELFDDNLNSIELRIIIPEDIDVSLVKSIVMYEEDEYGSKYVNIAKNVAVLPDDIKLQSWWIYPVFNI